ncbi:MAG: hypothetical protein WC449_05255 [Candidatus Paceibacterota bacterium]
MITMTQPETIDAVKYIADMDEQPLEEAFTLVAEDEVSVDVWEEECKR